MASGVFVLSVFFAGILSFFSPCILPLLPVYTGVLLDEGESWSWKIRGRSINGAGLMRTLCFIAGLSLVFVVLGFGAGVLGQLLYQAWFPIILGLLVVVLGLHQMEIFQLRMLERQKGFQWRRHAGRSGYGNAFVLGLTFSFSWTPCVGPVLSSVLALAASGGSSSWQGAFYMLVYTMGLALPFLAVALASSFLLTYFRKLQTKTLLLKKIGGGLLVLMGVLMILNAWSSLAL